MEEQKKAYPSRSATSVAGGHAYSQSSLQKAKQNKPNPTSFKGGTEAIKDHVLISSMLSTKRWMKTKEVFIDFAR